MNPEEINFSNWNRILFGDVPGSFYIELIIRALAAYLILIISMRLLGKRMSAQLNRNELAALAALAAAIGIPIQSPDRGLLPMIIIALSVVVIGRLVARLAFKSQKFEKLSLDNIDVLVEDSVMKLDRMLRTRITTDRLCAQLRSQGIKHLGEVKRLYIEANGSFTLVKEEKPKPGLSIIPDFDTELVAKQKKIDTMPVCKTCGKERDNNEEECANCKNPEWVAAVM